MEGQGGGCVDRWRKVVCGGDRVCGRGGVGTLRE